MRIGIRDKERNRLGTIEVDPERPPSVVQLSDDSENKIHLQWNGARDDQGFLRNCPVCGCREIFVRKDFPQVTGFWIVVAAVVFSMVLFGMQRVDLAVGVLLLVAIIDALVFFFAGRCLVCYRCRSEFRDLPIREDHPNWDLAVGEKYRPVRQEDSEESVTPES